MSTTTDKAFEVELKLVGRRAAWTLCHSLAEARRLVLRYIAGDNPLGEHLGSSTWHGGDVREAGGKKQVVAHVSFNGRVWEWGKRAWTKETRELTRDVVPAEELAAESDGRRTWQACHQELTALGYHQSHVTAGREEWLRGGEKVILRQDAAGDWSWIPAPSLDLAVSNGRVMVRGTALPETPEVSEAEAARRILLFPELLAKCEKIVAWLERLAARSEEQARTTRFETIRAASEADAKNYRATAADIRSVTDKAKENA